MHVVDWTGKGPVQTEAYESVGEGHYVAAGMFRDTTAAATLFGRRMTGNRDWHAIWNSAYLDSGLGRLREGVAERHGPRTGSRPLVRAVPAP